MQELARRCDTLIRLVEKENEEVEAAEREERKKSTKKTSLSRATDSSGAVAGGSSKVHAHSASALQLCSSSTMPVKFIAAFWIFFHETR